MGGVEVSGIVDVAGNAGAPSVSPDAMNTDLAQPGWTLKGWAPEHADEIDTARRKYDGQQIVRIAAKSCAERIPRVVWVVVYADCRLGIDAEETLWPDKFEFS